ncbi:MAG: protein O-mannosyl-transferase family [Anaerolineae bacterium]
MRLAAHAVRQRFSRDHWLGLILFGAALAAYIATLAPTVLDGDPALFQYTPLVGGVTYPTGYPVYLLAARLWLILFPAGQVAWRMNLFSALCGALALPFLYGVMRRILQDRPAALAGVLLFATLPTYWRWATEAKIYTLNVLLFSGLLYSLLRKGRPDEGRSPDGPRWLPPLLLGLGLGVHSTTLLLAPGVLWLWWLSQREAGRRPKVTRALRRWPLALLPLLLYAYVPLRAEALIARLGREPAIARGLLADFYHSGLGGWLRYFTAADFTGGVTTGSSWGLVPLRLRTVYLPLLLDDFTVWGAALGLLGALWLARQRPRRFWPLFLMYALPIPFVLTYGQGEQNAFLLTSDLMIAVFAGAAVAAIVELGRRVAGRGSPAFAALALLAFLGLPVRQAQDNIDWLGHKWDDSIERYWTGVLAHPLQEGGGVMAQWGDLTSFWYLQHAEGERPDLFGLYPPTQAKAIDWLAGGQALYIGGPLPGAGRDALRADPGSWPAGVGRDYQALSWGRLVRLVPLDQAGLDLLPDLAQPSDAVFDGRLRLLGAGFPGQVYAGGPLPVTLNWLALADLPPETSYSLRLVDGEQRLAQIDERLLSGWFPGDFLAANQPALGFSALPVPAGTLPGTYRLQLTAYQDYHAEWPLPSGKTVLDLGPISVTPPAPGDAVDLGDLKPVRGVQFNYEIALEAMNLSVSRVGQGKGFLITFLWRALQPPPEAYTLQVELVDRRGQSWRSWQSRPPAETSTWAAGQQVRQEVPVIVPADAPTGENALRLRLRWLRPDGSTLARVRWGLPWGDSATLPGVRVVEKENRRFEVPSLPHPVGANLGGQARLLGYDAPILTLHPGQSLPLTLYWQDIAQFDETYIVFTQLLGPCAPGRPCPLSDVQVLGQQDKAPGRRGKEPVTGWLPGEVVVDPYDIPLSPDAPPGEYRLIVGLYRPPDGPRLPVLDEAGQTVGDFVELTRVTVR